MKYIFLDTSALVYAYVPGCEDVRDAVIHSRGSESGSRVLVCDISLPEAAHLLIHYQQKGIIDHETLARGIERLEHDFGPYGSSYIVVEASGVVQHAISWMRLHDISSPAAVIVAAALAARPSLPPESELCLVSADERQITAAQTEGKPCGNAGEAQEWG